MIRIDSSRKFQTIIGFGVTVPVSAASVYGDGFYETLINDLGCSIFCSESGSEIASALKSIKPELILTSRDRPENVVSNMSTKATWGYLMALRVRDPSANLSSIYDFSYSRMVYADKFLIEEGAVDILWKAVFEDKSEISVRDPIFFTAIPSGALDLAAGISCALTNGFCAFITGSATTTCTKDSVTKALCDMGKKGPKFQAAKHFFKYVTPGMTRIEATGGSNTLLVNAFQSDQTVVNLINSGAVIVDEQIEFLGSESRQYTVFTSVENDFHHQDFGSMTGSKIDISLVPYSITTLIVEGP